MAANSDAFALTRQGQVYAWGANGYGQLGNGTTVNENGKEIPVSVPVLVKGLDHVKQIAATDESALHGFSSTPWFNGNPGTAFALTTGGSVYAWGFGRAGELGDGNDRDSTTPVRVTGLSDVTGVVGGDEIGIATTASGLARTTATTATTTAPATPPSPHTVTFVANGGTGTMAPETASAPAALSHSTFTRAGYTFAGWGTRADSRGTAYANGAICGFTTSITLYALWAGASTTTTTSPARTSPQATKLVSPGAGVGTGFGSSVAVSRGTIVVGAPFHANMAGQAFVFQEGAGGWHQVAELVGSGVVANDQFGTSVAASGGTIVVGAPFHAHGTGEAFVFQEGAGGWHEVARLVGSGTAAHQFGTSVAVSGGTVVVGAEGNKFINYPGGAYVFQEGAGGWHQVAELVGSGVVGADLFGASVAVSGPTVVVGARGFNASNVGRVYIFQEGTGGWHEVARLVGSGAAVGTAFGYSVAVSGGTAVVGALSAFRAFIFQEGAGGWHQVADLVGPGIWGDDFGCSVAVSGGTAVVGASGYNNGADPDNPIGAGGAFIFQEGAGGWHQVADLVGSVGVGTDLFGQSVAVSGPTVVVGELNDGQAYVFHG